MNRSNGIKLFRRFDLWYQVAFVLIVYEAAFSKQRLSVVSILYGGGLLAFLEFAYCLMALLRYGMSQRLQQNRAIMEGFERSQTLGDGGVVPASRTNFVDRGDK